MLEEIIAGMTAGHDEMDGEGGFGGTHRPDMEIVNLVYPRTFGEESPYREGFDSFGNRV